MISAVKGGSATQALEDALAAQFENQAEIENSCIIKLNVTHSVITTLRLPEIRFDYRWTIREVKV